MTTPHFRPLANDTSYTTLNASLLLASLATREPEPSLSPRIVSSASAWLTISTDPNLNQIDFSHIPALWQRIIVTGSSITHLASPNIL